MTPSATLADDLCPCGRPLHYSDARTRALVEKLIAQHGETVIVHAPDSSQWLVPRHYIALHGLYGRDIVKFARIYHWRQVGGPTDGHHDQ